MIEGHGNDRYKYNDRVRIDFSSNIAFNNHSEAILNYLRDHLRAIQNYPDPRASTLSDKIARHHGVSRQQVLVFNGSAEAFYVAAHLLSGKEVRTLIFVPSFAEYEDSCKAYEHQIDYLPLSHFEKVDYAPYHSVWIGLPNNPDGQRVPMEKIRSLADSFPNCTFVVDYAYNELSASSESHLIDPLPSNLILIYSLTKTFGIPGLRIGFAVAESKVIERMAALKTPWSVNALSLVAGEYIMDHYEILMANKQELLSESRYLQDKINALTDFKVINTDCNFFLCKLTNGHTANELHCYLLEQHGILIRNASNFRSLTDSHFRLSVQTREENNQLIHALNQWTTTL